MIDIEFKITLFDKKYLEEAIEALRAHANSVLLAVDDDDAPELEHISHLDDESPGMYVISCRFDADEFDLSDELDDDYENEEITLYWLKVAAEEKPFQVAIVHSGPGGIRVRRWINQELGEDEAYASGHYTFIEQTVDNGV